MRVSLGTVTGVLEVAHKEPLEPVEKLAVSLMIALVGFRPGTNIHRIQ
jgi:hypothetical protein